MGIKISLWLICVVATVPLSLPTRNIIAINSGGPTSVAPDGTVYEQDRCEQ